MKTTSRITQRAHTLLYTRETVGWTRLVASPAKCCRSAGEETGWWERCVSPKVATEMRNEHLIRIREVPCESRRTRYAGSSPYECTETTDKGWKYDDGIFGLDAPMLMVALFAMPCRMCWQVYCGVTQVLV